MNTLCTIRDKDGEIVVEFERPQPFGQTELKLSEEFYHKMHFGETLCKKLAKAIADCKKGPPSMLSKRQLTRSRRLVELQGYTAGVGHYDRTDLTHDDELALAALLVKWRSLAASVYQTA